VAVVQYQDIGLADLMLDGQNPRHTATTGQREAIEALFDGEPQKLIELAKDIVEHGVSPIDTTLVLKRGNSYTVLEGNRRLAVLKLLSNPDLAPTEALRKRFRDLSQDVHIPHDIRCAVVVSREEGRHWIELRHTGERGGAGVVPWSAEATNRFAGRRGSQADKALIVVDAIEKAFPDNQKLQEDLAKARKNRLTTFGRLVSDPSVREQLGIEIDETTVYLHYPPKQAERAFARILSDLADNLTVSDLKTKEQRKQYVGKTRDDLPNPADYRSTATPLQRETPKPPPKKKPTPTPRPPIATRPRPLFDNVVLTNLGGKVADILEELKRIDVDGYPNACAALIRVVMELAVGQVHEINNWNEPKNLREGVRKCLSKLDATNKDQTYQAVRAGLQDGTSLLSVRTMQAYLHNPHFHPTGTELRRIAANYAPFLAGLDTLV
jgi:hypothetical protein